MTAPLFIHDCRRCTFVGHFPDIYGHIGDGYICQHMTSPTYQGSVIWRLSDEDWNNHSFPLESVVRMRDDRDAGRSGAEGSVFTDILDAWQAKVRKCRHSCGQGAHPFFAPHLKEGEVQCRDCGHIEPAPPPLTYADCLEGPWGCSGAVEYRTPLSGTGRSYPRCDLHWWKRCERQVQINVRYFGTPSSHYCRHGNYIGDPYGADYICGRCENDD